MRKFLLYSCSFLLIVSQLNAQGVIVNEVSNGAAGSEEYLELVVIGSTAAPTAGVDLSGWIIDDNNGDFTGLSTGVGIATGHMRIASGCLTNVAPGTIILIYNDAEVNGSITAAGLTPDETDTNNDCVYVLPANSSCLETCTSTPTATAPASSAYSPCTYASPGDWFDVNLANNGDAIQVRDPSANFYHGFCYGTPLTNPYPNFPASLGAGTSFNVQTASGTGHNYYFSSGDFTNGTNFSRGAVPADETPGAANDDGNRYFINALRDGTYNYSTLSDPANSGSSASLISCITLPVYLRSFDAHSNGLHNQLHWVVESATDKYFDFEIQQSRDALHFEPIGIVRGDLNQANYYFVDQYPTIENYYRLKMIDPDGSFRYSKIVQLTQEELLDEGVSIFPNPVQEELTLTLKETFDQKVQIRITDLLGRELKTIELPARSQFQRIDVSEFPKGTYLISLKAEGLRWSRKFVK